MQPRMEVWRLDRQLSNLKSVSEGYGLAISPPKQFFPVFFITLLKKQSTQKKGRERFGG